MCKVSPLNELPQPTRLTHKDILRVFLPLFLDLRSLLRRMTLLARRALPLVRFFTQ